MTTKSLTRILSSKNVSFTRHESGVPYIRGTTSKAEKSISLVKSTLRRLCMSDFKHWSDLLPVVQSIINSAKVNCTVPRNQLFYSPLIFEGYLNLSGLLCPEFLFEHSTALLNELNNTGMVSTYESLLGTKCGPSQQPGCNSKPTF